MNNSLPHDEPSLREQGYSIRAASNRTFGTFTVTNPRGITYTVTPLENHCTCPDCRLRARRCKHITGLYALMLDCWYEINDDPTHEEAMYLMRCEMDEVLARMDRSERRAA